MKAESKGSQDGELAPTRSELANRLKTWRDRSIFVNGSFRKTKAPTEEQFEELNMIIWTLSAPESSSPSKESWREEAVKKVEGLPTALPGDANNGIPPSASVVNKREVLKIIASTTKAEREKTE